MHDINEGSPSASLITNCLLLDSATEIVMEPIKEASGGFAMDPSPAIKRHRDDHFTLNLEPSNFLHMKFGTGAPGTELCRPPKKFAGDIQFEVTHDLNFEHLSTDYISTSKDPTAEFKLQQLSKNPNTLATNQPLIRPKENAIHYSPELPTLSQSKCSSEFIGQKLVTNLPKHPETPLVSISLSQKTEVANIQRASPKEVKSGNETPIPVLPDSKSDVDSREHVQFSSRNDSSAPGLEAKTTKVIERPSSQSQYTAEHFLESTEAVNASESEHLSRSEKPKGQMVTASVSKLIQRPVSPSLKPAFSTKQPVVIRATRLTAINENLASDDQGKLNVHKSVSVTDSEQKQDATELTIHDDSAELSKATSVIKYDKEKLPSFSVTDAEIELCTQWLNNERSTTLETVKQRSEQDRTVEATLCQELEQMLLTTKQILQSELEFSVRLCSIRGQCLLFQESRRLTFENSTPIVKFS